MRNYFSVRKLQLIIFCCQLILTSAIYAQESKGGRPLSFRKSMMDINQVPVITMPAFNIESMIQEDSIQSMQGFKSMRFAKAFEVKIDLKSQGLMEAVNDTGKIWRLGIKSSGAFSINIIFSDFNLPSNAELFIYNSDKQNIIGAFTYENNQKFKTLATSPVMGDEVFIELFEPNHAEFPAHAIIGRVNHDYKNILNLLKDGYYGKSESCEVNINCPQGAGWQNEKHSVARIIINGVERCSGSLVNNTLGDGKPYFLTATHCYAGFTDKHTAANNTIFYFNYESPTCISQDVTPIQSSGANLIAYWGTSDFFLEQLTHNPPSGSFYNGWDRDNNSSSKETGIHHPEGDIKKISSSSNPVTSTAWLSDIQDNSANHWRIVWTSAVTEHGSSGSPLYNQNHRVVGQLHGGWSDCKDTSYSGYHFGPHQPDWYGKIYSSWNGGTADTSQLSKWLDPCYCGVHTLNGKYCPPVTITGDPYLTGTNLLCTTYPFQVYNVGCGDSIAWSCTSNITMVSGQSSNPCTFQKYSNGNGSVTATVFRPCGNRVFTMQVHTGPYSSSDYPIFGPITASCHQYVYYNVPQLIGVTAYNWTWPGWWAYVSGQNSRYLALQTGTQGGTVAVGVDNTCGHSGSYYTLYTSVSGCYSLVVSPNPASDIVNVTIIPDQTAGTDSTAAVIAQPTNSANTIYKVTITDLMGTSYSNATKNTTSFTLPVQSLPNGNYIITVDDGVNKCSGQLVIKH